MKNALIGTAAPLRPDKDGFTVCPSCRGNQWRAVKIPRLGSGVYEVRCDDCNGFGWVDEEHGVRP